MKTVELVGMPSATARIARELEANSVRVFVRDSTKPHEVAKPISDVDLVVLLGANGLGSAVRDAAKWRGIDCVALPYDWTRARPILEARGVLAMGQRPFEKIAEPRKEHRCACGRVPVTSGLVPLPDGSVHGEKQCNAPRLEAPKPEQPHIPLPPDHVSRENKIAWAKTEALRDRVAAPTVIARRVRAKFGVGVDSNSVCAEVLSTALREAIEAVKVAGAAEGLHRLVLDFDASGVVAVSWERAIVRSGKATL